MSHTRLTCRSCQAQLKLTGPVATGTSIKCPRCGKAIRAPEPEPQEEDFEVAEEEGEPPTPKKGRAEEGVGRVEAKKRPAPRTQDEEEERPRKPNRSDEDEEEPDEPPVKDRSVRERKGRRQKEVKQGAPALLWVGLAGGLVLLAGGVTLAIVLLRPGKGGGQPAGGGNPSGTGGSAIGSDSPQAVLEAYNQAAEKGDYQVMIDCLSPKAQREEAGIRVSNGWHHLGLLVRARDADTAVIKKMATNQLDVMAKHGLTAETTKKLALAKEKDRAKIRSELLALVKDPVAFAVEFRAAEDKDHGERIPPSKVMEKLGMMFGKLTDVKIQGDKATGNLPVQVKGKVVGHQPVEFVKIAGKWKIDNLDSKPL
jgi:hypothetical protein